MTRVDKLSNRYCSTEELILQCVTWFNESIIWSSPIFANFTGTRNTVATSTDINVIVLYSYDNGYAKSTIRIRFNYVNVSLTTIKCTLFNGASSIVYNTSIDLTCKELNNIINPQRTCA